MALLSLGAALFGVLIEAVAQGRLTGRGPLSRNLREFLDMLGVPPYAVISPSGAAPLERMGAVGAVLALGADGADALLAGPGAQPGVRAALARTLVAVFARILESRSMLMGVAQAASALRGAALPGELDIWAASADGMSHEASLAVGRAAVDAALAHTPGYGETAPSPRTPWGAPIPPPHLTRLAAPYLPNSTALEEALARVGADPAPPSRVQRGVELTPIEFDRFVVLATEGLKDPATGLSARGLAEALVLDGLQAKSGDAGKSNGAGAIFAAASDGPDGEKAAILRRLVQLFRSQAMQQLIEEYPSLAARIDRAQRFQRRTASTEKGLSQ